MKKILISAIVLSVLVIAAVPVVESKFINTTSTTVNTVSKIPVVASKFTKTTSPTVNNVSKENGSKISFDGLIHSAIVKTATKLGINTTGVSDAVLNIQIDHKEFAKMATILKSH